MITKKSHLVSVSLSLAVIAACFSVTLAQASVVTGTLSSGGTYSSGQTATGTISGGSSGSSQGGNTISGTVVGGSSGGGGTVTGGNSVSGGGSTGNGQLASANADGEGAGSNSVNTTNGSFVAGPAATAGKTSSVGTSVKTVATNNIAPVSTGTANDALGNIVPQAIAATPSGLANVSSNVPAAPWWPIVAVVLLVILGSISAYRLRKSQGTGTR